MLGRMTASLTTHFHHMGGKKDENETFCITSPFHQHLPFINIRASKWFIHEINFEVIIFNFISYKSKISKCWLALKRLVISDLWLTFEPVIFSWMIHKAFVIHLTINKNSLKLTGNWYVGAKTTQTFDNIHKLMKHKLSKSIIYLLYTISLCNPAKKESDFPMLISKDSSFIYTQTSL